MEDSIRRIRSSSAGGLVIACSEIEDCLSTAGHRNSHWETNNCTTGIRIVGGEIFLLVISSMAYLLYPRILRREKRRGTRKVSKRHD